jgi:hypothetical protein
VFLCGHESPSFGVVGRGLKRQCSSPTLSSPWSTTTSRSTRACRVVTLCRGLRSWWRRNSCALAPSELASTSGSSTSTGSLVLWPEHPRPEQTTLRRYRRLCSSVRGLSLQHRISVPAALGAPSTGGALCDQNHRHGRQGVELSGRRNGRAPQRVVPLGAPERQATLLALYVVRQRHGERLLLYLRRLGRLFGGSTDSPT